MKDWRVKNHWNRSSEVATACRFSGYALRPAAMMKADLERHKRGVRWHAQAPLRLAAAHTAHYGRNTHPARR